MNLPNKITIFRVLLIPIIMIIAEIDALLKPAFLGMTIQNVIILAIFLIGTFSDFLDGYIARKQNIVTNFGKFADPLADKILVLAVMVILLEQNSLLPGWVVTVILAREFIVTGFRILAASQNVVIAAGWTGKIKTNLQFLMVILLLIDGPRGVTYGAFEIIILIVIGLATLMTIISGTEYIVKNLHVFKDNKEG
jgi:CDP-diacylglycerol--glycerol-3-phosphate 3-phosphatidyltransferase